MNSTKISEVLVVLMLSASTSFATSYLKPTATPVTLPLTDIAQEKCPKVGTAFTKI